MRQGLDGRRHWGAVERHVDQGGDPAGRGGTRRGRKALPLGAPRLIDVYVRIDDAGQDDPIAHILDPD